MNRNLTLSVLALLSGLSATAGHAEGVVVRGEVVGASRMAVVERALVACADAMMARLFPGQRIATTPALAADEKVAAEAASHDEFIINMTAATRGQSGTLALAECTVTRKARVVSLSVRVNDKAQLARLRASDLLLQLAGR
jgi:hypothetical protein